jgi:hypothetical protein
MTHPQSIKLTSAERRERYFSSKGIRCPRDADGRLELAVRLLNEERVDYRSIEMLFDPEEDIHHPRWPLFMSIFLSSDINSEAFQPELALEFFDLALNRKNDPSILSEADKRLLGQISRYSVIQTAIDKNFLPSPADDLLADLRESDFYIIDLLKAILQIQVLRKDLLKQNGCNTLSEFMEKVPKDVNPPSPEYMFDGKASSREVEAAWYLIRLSPWKDYATIATCANVARALRHTEYRFYNPGIGKALLTYAAIRGPEYRKNSCSIPSFQLGHLHNDGETGRVDHNAAVFWFEVAQKLGNGMAPLMVRDLLIDNDERSEDKGNTAFQKRLDGLTKDAESMGQPCAQHSVVMRHAYGWGDWNDQARVRNHYDQIILDDFWAPPQLFALFAHALRAFVLGKTRLSAQEILDVLAEVKAGQEDFYESDLRIPVGHFEKILGRMVDPEYANTVVNTTNLIRDAYEQQTHFSIADEKLKHLDQSSEVSRLAKRDAVWAAHTLAQIEKWYLASWLQNKFERVNASYLQLDLTEMKKAALIMGPFYNPIDPGNGLPILGAKLPPSESEEEVTQQRMTLGSYVPQPGVVGVLGVRAIQNGDIKIVPDIDNRRPALLVPEDLEVIKALVFADVSGPIWPALSLERKVEGILDDDYKWFKAKVWKPSWVGHTDLGKTLYIVDRLMGQMTWSPKTFTVVTSNQCFDPKFPEIIKAFVEDLRFTGGSNRVSHSRLINVFPEHIPLSPLTKAFNQRGEEVWAVDVLNAKMRVNGAYTRELSDTEEDRQIGWNDTRFGQGRLTQRLTDHYDDIAKMIPAFDRYKQLMALLYLVSELREQGYKLHPSRLETYRSTMIKFESLPDVPRAQRVIAHHPFTIDFL